MIKNPFVFGKIVKGEHFCNRATEIEQIKKMVYSNQHIVIISPRRYGKTSLAINALEKNNMPHIYVDCSLIEDEKDIVSIVINDYAKKFDNIATLEKFLTRFNFSFSITLNPISISVNQIKTDSLKSLLTETGKNYAIVFDEFQDIYEKDKNLINKIRSTVQFLEKSVIMLGSKKHLLHKMFLKPRGIFYNFGYALHLEKIGQNEFKKFISHCFRKNDINVEEKEVDNILEITECHPFFTQYFCHFIFEKWLTKKEKIEHILSEVLNMNSIFYEETYYSLSSNQQKALLLLSCGKKEVYSAELLRRFNIRSSQALQKALNSLIKKEIVDKNSNYYIVDIFFKYWLYRKVLNQKV